MLMALRGSEAVKEELDGVETDGWVGDGDVQDVGIREGWTSEDGAGKVREIARIREVSVELGVVSRKAKAAT